MAEYLYNKKATFDFELLDTYECGVEFLGTEVKSIRNHHGSLIGSYVSLVGSELFLVGAHIPAWQEKNVPASFDTYRSRKLLVHKDELLELAKASQTKGLTIVPVSLYGKGRHIKAQIAIARGKKLFDKRETLKKKAVKRDIEREVS